MFTLHSHIHSRESLQSQGIISTSPSEELPLLQVDKSILGVGVNEQPIELVDDQHFINKGMNNASLNSL